MKITVTESGFARAFRDCGRESQFSSEAQSLLFDYLESLEQGSGEEIELDVVALCCEYSECEFEEVAADYDLDIEGMDEDAIKDCVRDYLNDQTSVVGETDSTIIFAQF